MTHPIFSLAGSGLGLLIAAGIARLFHWLRHRAPDAVSYAGNGLAILTGCFGVCFFVMAPLLLLPHLVCAAIVWCQSRQPSRFPLSWVHLLGITVIEALAAVFAAWQMNTMLAVFASDIVNLTLPEQSALLGNANLALALTLLLLETVGPPRYREAPGRGA